MRLSRVATIRPFTQKIALPAAFERYTLIDRASYEYAPIDPPAALVALAEEVTQRTLSPASARVIRMTPGDYILARHEELHDDHRVEVIVDCSPVAVPGADVRYQRAGNVFFLFPSQPQTASIVERDPTTQAYHTYVSKLSTGVVQRLVVQLVDR
jgi:hypothetical protein